MIICLIKISLILIVSILLIVGLSSMKLHIWEEHPSKSHPISYIYVSSKPTPPMKYPSKSSPKTHPSNVYFSKERKKYKESSNFRLMENGKLMFIDFKLRISSHSTSLPFELLPIQTEEHRSILSQLLAMETLTRGMCCLMCCLICCL